MEKNESIGLLADRYQIKKTLGKGGFGITYLAEDLKNHGNVVLKEYMPVQYAMKKEDRIEAFPEYQKEYKSGLKKFLKEAKLMASLETVPEIVRVLNYFEEQNTAYLVLEYIRGTSLRDYLEMTEQPMSFREAADFIHPVLTALSCVHKKHILHRDLTPDNILVSENGSLRIIDFGSAREYTEDDRTRTVLIKPGYAPLEQYSRQGKQGPWTDIYSLCAVIYEMITGIPPLDAAVRAKEDQLYLPSMYGAEIRPEEEAALMKGLSVDWHHRYQMVKELEAALYPAERNIQEKRNKTKKWIFTCAASVLIMIFLAGTWIYIDRSYTEYAGNYGRGSRKAIEYMDFVKAHALSETKEDNGISYELSEEDVLDYGLPCNRYRFDKKREELEAFIKQLNWNIQKQDERTTKCNVFEGEYGHIETDFGDYQKYTDDTGMELIAYYDLVDQDILGIAVSCPAACKISPEGIAAELFQFLTGYDEEQKKETRSYLKKQISDILKEESMVIHIYDWGKVNLHYTGVSEEEISYELRRVEADNKNTYKSFWQ